MSAAARPGRALALLALLAALGVAGCGPYANVAQKLDVTARVAGDTWIAKGNADGTELRILIVGGTPDANGSAPFSFSSLQVAHSRGDSVYTLQGTWIEVGNAGATTLYVEHEYLLPDEFGRNVLSRVGTTRSDERFSIPATATRGAGQLVVTGDARVSGTYVPLAEALGRLGTATEYDAACAFQVANLGMLRSQGRIIGFGGPGITQYLQAETYVATVYGSLEIKADLTGSSFPPDRSHVVVQYRAFEDVGGVTVEGPMITDVDSGGTGSMSGVMRFTFEPVDASGTPGTPVTGTIDYGGPNAVHIVGGDAVDGGYTVAFDTGPGTAFVPTATAPSPSVSTCLALP